MVLGKKELGKSNDAASREATMSNHNHDRPTDMTGIKASEDGKCWLWWEGVGSWMYIRLVRMNDVDVLDKENSILTQQPLS